MISYGRQLIDEEDIAAVVAVLQSDWLTQGPAVPRFEQAVAQYCGVAHAVAVGNGTMALHLGCVAAGVGPGDLVWTSPNTFVASANCARYCGAAVDFVDIDAQTLNLCPQKLADKLVAARRDGRLPKLVIPVHFAGRSCDMEAIAGLGREFGFRVMEDASHALGARYRDTRVGSGRYADLTTLFKWTALSGNTRPEVFLGPALSHPLRTRDETRSDMLVYETGTFNEVVRTRAFNVRDNLAEWEFSAVLGAGFIIQPGVARIHLGYRYVFGLSNIYRYVVDYTDVNGSLLGSGSMFNRTHMITIGYSIPLSREAWTETPSPR